MLKWGSFITKYLVVVKETATLNEFTCNIADLDPGIFQKKKKKQIDILFTGVGGFFLFFSFFLVVRVAGT